MSCCISSSTPDMNVHLHLRETKIEVETRYKGTKVFLQNHFFKILHKAEKITEIIDIAAHFFQKGLAKFITQETSHFLHALHEGAHQLEHFLHPLCFFGDLYDISRDKFVVRHMDGRIVLAATASRVMHAVAHFLGVQTFFKQLNLSRLKLLDQALPLQRIASIAGYAFAMIHNLIYYKVKEADFKRQFIYNLSGLAAESLQLMTQIKILNVIGQIFSLIHSLSYLYLLHREEVSRYNWVHQFSPNGYKNTAPNLPLNLVTVTIEIVTSNPS